MKPPLIIAHRGHSSRYVENTLSAYRGAVNAGADVVECDARLSNDRNVWACHDADLARLTGTPSPVAGMSSGELAAIRLAGGERLMKLPSVLTEIAPDRTVLIDLKTDELALIEAVIRDVAAAKAVDLVWIGMWSIAQTSRVHSLEPKLKLLRSSQTTIWQTNLNGPVQPLSGSGREILVFPPQNVCLAPARHG